MKKKVLFVCIHNSARSQMAEAFCNSLGGDRFIAESAGLEPNKLNPNVVKVMQEIGIDISGNECNSVFKYFREGRSYSSLITLCDKTSAERCPIFSGLVIDDMIHWSFKDPSSFKGTESEILQQTRRVRDEIRQQIMEFLEKD
ncbi:MAG: arsenate reductase ArsC [Candidatus Stygibacter frigidus]|nr:arsenate reductase ArsC [Candidatus Stygibacter frigidus]